LRRRQGQIEYGVGSKWFDVFETLSGETGFIDGH
jgi:hypothetical protein